MDPALAARLLVLIALANGAPIVARRVLGHRLAAPLDLGMRLRDGPVLGESKTWRGVVAAVLACAAAAPVLGFPPPAGAAFAAAAMAGDACTSFMKRRMGLAPGRSMPGLDQALEAALPLFLVHRFLGLDGIDVAVLVVLFTVLDLVLSPLLHRLGIRRRPG